MSEDIVINEALPSYVHQSRYARFLHDENRRESWLETVTRYFDFFKVHLKETCNYSIPEELLKELQDAVLNREVMPSMRCIMTAGDALRRDHIAGYNPVAGNTLVLTREVGLVPISKLVGQTRDVLNINGQWTPGVFRSYGSQRVYDVNLKLNSNTKHKISCTANHRWVLEDGKVVSTVNLKAGDQIPFRAAPKPIADNIDYRLGIIHGLVYGDGTLNKKTSKRARGFMIRLCSDAEELLPYFDGYPVCYPPSFGGDPVVQLYDGFAQTHDLKSLPQADETESYLLGFARGWLAADGSVSSNSQVSIFGPQKAVDWWSNVAPKIGFVVQHIDQAPDTTNYGKRTEPGFRIMLSRSSLCAEDFLITRKRDRFRPLNSHYVVSSVDDNGDTTEVFCAEVDDTNTFCLDKGLITGNCSYLSISTPRSFAEILHILMNGTGVGFSVERQYVNKLPEIPEALYPTDTTISVIDSKIGWAKALQELIHLLYSGNIPKWDLSKIRPAGSVLKTFGGRASGPEPLDDLFRFVVETFKGAVGRRLTSIEAHDIACMIGNSVVVGGVRRSALISLSNLSDDRMRAAKTGQWWQITPHRRLANNSAVYNDKQPTTDTFMTEWKALYDSKSGERGLFSRWAAKNVIERSNDFRKQHFSDFEGMRIRDPNHEWGCNPCSEILLRDAEFCNLSEVVVRATDTEETLKRKVYLATVLGTWQSTLTSFRFLSKRWQTNTEDERLLGVSLTGVMDNKLTNGSLGVEKLKNALTNLRKTAIATNHLYAKSLGVEMATAITCIKPSGTVSTLVNSASGIHMRHSEYYLRTARQDSKDPLARFMIDQGFYHEPDAMNKNDLVFYFPQKSPKGAFTRDSLTAIQHLEIWKLYQLYWCDHKPSITVTVRENEWIGVGAWVFDNFEWMSGVSFLPHSDHTYAQAPYIECTKETYDEYLVRTPKTIDWSQLKNYEQGDTTTGSQELACSAAGGCEII